MSAAKMEGWRLLEVADSDTAVAENARLDLRLSFADGSTRIGRRDSRGVAAAKACREAPAAKSASKVNHVRKAASPTLGRLAAHFGIWKISDPGPHDLL